MHIIANNGDRVLLKTVTKCLGISHQAFYRSAKRRNLTPEQELIRRLLLLEENKTPTTEETAP